MHNTLKKGLEKGLEKMRERRHETADPESGTFARPPMTAEQAEIEDQLDAIDYELMINEAITTMVGELHDDIRVAVTERDAAVAGRIQAAEELERVAAERDHLRGHCRQLEADAKASADHQRAAAVYWQRIVKLETALAGIACRLDATPAISAAANAVLGVA